MPKWKSSYDSNRKYNPNWEKQFVWLKKDGHHGESFCKLCNCSIAPRQSNLHNHEKPVKHKNKLRPQGQSELAVTKTVKNNSINNATKKVELEKLEMAVRAELLLSKQCCRDFQVTAEMLQNFKSDIVYQSEFSDEISLFD